MEGEQFMSDEEVRDLLGLHLEPVSVITPGIVYAEPGPSRESDPRVLLERCIPSKNERWS